MMRVSKSNFAFLKFLSFATVLAVIISGCTLRRLNYEDAPPVYEGEDALQVTTTKDSFDGRCTNDDCSLRDAIYIANQSPDLDTIILPRGMYFLDQEIFARHDDSGLYGDLDIWSDIVILGAGIDRTVIDGKARDRIFHVFPDYSLRLENMTLINGNGNDSKWKVEVSWAECALKFNFVTAPKFLHAPMSTLYSTGDPDFKPEKDCELSPSGTITLEGFTRAVDERGGGAIANRGNLDLKDVSIVFNLAKQGGAIKNIMGNVSMDGGFLCNNTAERGGGIYNESGTVRLSNLGICRNHASERGSGLYSTGDGWSKDDGELSLVNVTLAENDGDSEGGVFFSRDSNAELLNVTLAYNQAIGLVTRSSNVSLRNTILAENQPSNCEGEIQSLDYNIDDGDSCQLTLSHDWINTSPRLFALLSDLGGYYTLSIDSPALDAGSISHCPSRDQEGESRPQGNGCDIGADEVSFQPLSLPPEEATAEATATDAPSATPHPTDQPTNTTSPPTLTPTAMELAGIIGNVWQDDNGDGVWSRFTELSIANYPVRLGAGACSSAGFATDSTDGAGVYFFGDLQPGTYCVSINPGNDCSAYSLPTTATSFTVNLDSGETATIRFGLEKRFCVD